MTDAVNLPYWHGQPLSSGELRHQDADFFVDEELGFEMSGEGEQLALWIEKQGTNTDFVADKLSRFFGVKRMSVSYSGKKDRNAVTRQWFTVHLPGQNVEDLPDIPGCKILTATRHNKKLRTGSHKFNRFVLRLRNVTDAEDVIQRVALINQHGVPNYFGEQRFGHGFGNLRRAEEMFAGKRVKDRNKRGLYLSAARSHLFNLFIAERLQAGSLLEPIEGDVYQLAGSNSVFHEALDDSIRQRVSEHDILITGPFVGRGTPKTTDAALDLEQQFMAEHAAWCDGLAAAGLKQERRALVLKPIDLACQIEQDDVVISFRLPSGAFATSVLRELCRYHVAEREYKKTVQD